MENITNLIDRLAWILFSVFLGVNVFMFGHFIVYAVIAFFKKIHEENSKGFTGTKLLSNKEALEEYRKSLK